jgi:DNA recombination protein RmuC
MDTTSLLLGLLAGVVIGAFAAAWWSKQRSGDLLAPLREAHEREKTDLHDRLIDQTRTAEERNQEVVRLNGLLGAEKQNALGLAKRLEEQKAELEHVQKRMTEEFENIANRLLKERGKELNEQQQAKLSDILKPLNEKIKDFEEQVRKTYEAEGRERFALKGEIMRLVEQNQKLGQEASDLTKALKGDSQAQGAWGEMILEKLLDSSGLVKGQEYSMQESTTLDDGSRLRPDAVIMLPEDKHLIIDSKVSLLHYERFAATSEGAERDRLLKLHVESLRAHARGLSDKDYTKLYGVRSVDFVLMFVPIEPAFLLALRERPEIFQEAYDRQVVMVTHSTLMATLRTIHGIWKNERVARNHMEIADRAGKLYDKFIGFTEDLIKVGNQLKLAKGSYDEAMGKLSEGSGNLVRQVEMIKELGAKTNKVQNDKLLTRALEE